MNDIVIGRDGPSAFRHQVVDFPIPKQPAISMNDVKSNGGKIRSFVNEKTELKDVSHEKFQIELKQKRNALSSLQTHESFKIYLAQQEKPHPYGTGGLERSGIKGIIDACWGPPVKLSAKEQLQNEINELERKLIAQPVPESALTTLVKTMAHDSTGVLNDKKLQKIYTQFAGDNQVIDGKEWPKFIAMCKAKNAQLDQDDPAYAYNKRLIKLAEREYEDSLEN